jgi:predicted RNase H-like HicB family nuclease
LLQVYPLCQDLFPERSLERRNASVHSLSTGVPLLTAVIEKGDGLFVALCPELDIPSQGPTVEAARDNLREAIDLFFESASPADVASRLKADLYAFEVSVGSAKIVDQKRESSFLKASTHSPASLMIPAMVKDWMGLWRGS